VSLGRRGREDVEPIDPDFEKRLAELRARAERDGRVDAPGVQAAGGPVPGAAGGPAGRTGEAPHDGSPSGTEERHASYYGRPALHAPVWTWEIPVYFFVGGIAGSSGVIAWAARLTGAGLELQRTAIWISLACTVLSAALLILDLGRPARFLHMLRIFKWRSPMSVGVWVLSAFGGFVTLSVIGVEWLSRGSGSALASVLATLGTWVAAPLGAAVATYTGVLIGATVVPAWNLHRATLPLHFGVAGFGSAAAVLELWGFQTDALWVLGLLAATVETLVGVTIELDRNGAADRALRTGRAGAMLRGAGLLAGPVSLVLRLVGATHLAAISFLVGALISRFGWLEAGRASARDPEAALERASATGRG
jgi:formate-dependent nitrite reductase membrane component NrfD